MNQTPHKSLSALLLINPKSRQGAEALECAQENLTRRGFKVMVPKFESPNEFSTLIEQYASQIDLVVVGGGDGSVRSAIEGVMKADLPLGVLPLGTANNFARNLGIENSIESACDVLIGGHETRVDVERSMVSTS